MTGQALRVLSFIGFLGLSLLAGPAAAEKAVPKENPVVAAAEDFTKDFNEADKRHFGVLYSNYNLVKVVEAVQKDVGAAVGKCGAANPDMKKPLNERHDQWDKAIKPVMKEAEANINNMVFAQDYAKPKKIREFFKLIDKARTEKDAEVEKVPVTSKEACEYLLKTMDSTQENLTNLLQATLISLPQAIQLEQEEQARRQAEESKGKAGDKAAVKSKDGKDTVKDTGEEDDKEAGVADDPASGKAEKAGDAVKGEKPE